MEQLKPCPFCGKTPKIEKEPGSYGYYPDVWVIKCCNGIRIPHQAEEYDWEKRKHFRVDEIAKNEITKVWNTRND